MVSCVLKRAWCCCPDSAMRSGSNRRVVGMNHQAHLLLLPLQRRPCTEQSLFGQCLWRASKSVEDTEEGRRGRRVAVQVPRVTKTLAVPGPRLPLRRASPSGVRPVPLHGTLRHATSLPSLHGARPHPASPRPTFAWSAPRSRFLAFFRTWHGGPLPAWRPLDRKHERNTPKILPFCR